MYLNSTHRRDLRPHAPSCELRHPTTLPRFAYIPTTVYSHSSNSYHLHSTQIFHVSSSYSTNPPLIKKFPPYLINLVPYFMYVHYGTSTVGRREGAVRDVVSSQATYGLRKKLRLWDKLACRWCGTGGRNGKRGGGG